MPVEALVTERSASPEELERLGDDPVVIELTAEMATLEVAASGEDRELLRGPYESSRPDFTCSG